jgi:hypothetical protein
VRTCGPNYSIQSGPYDAGNPGTPNANYAHVVEYSINVKHNQEGPVAFVLVGQRRAGETWHTLNPGTGP